MQNITDMNIKREQYLNALIKKRDNGRVKIITGIRRCGKSYLLFHLYKDYLRRNGIAAEQIVELDLDEIDNLRYRNPFELNDYIKYRTQDESKRYYVLIDEIQMCAEVRNPYIDDPQEKVTFIDALLGLMKRPNLDIYVTGSNSKMLSKDVLTQFRDRGDNIHLYPLSFSEFSQAYTDLGLAWREYCLYGGMPYVLSLETHAEKSRYLRELFDETYVKDIIERHGVRNDREVLEVLLDFVSSAVGSLTNPSKLAQRFMSERKLNISHATIAKYLDFFIEAYIMHSAKRYDIKGAAYFTTPLKYYFTDIGLRNARLNFRQVEENHIMENIIYNDLLRRGCDVDVGVVSTFRQEGEDGSAKPKKVRINLEVDFVVNSGMQRYYIQSALRIDEPQKREQEINSLLRIGDSFRKIVVVKDDIIPWYDDKGIYYTGVKEFLLNETAL